MKEKIPILIVVSLFIIAISSVIAKPAKSVNVLLLPTEYGKPSKVIPISSYISTSAPIEVLPNRNRFSGSGGTGIIPLSVDREIGYDNGTFASSLGGLLQGFHLGVWFQSPAACTLLEVRYYFATGGDISVYATDPADTINFLTAYEEYHGGVNPGPDPRETYFLDEQAMTVAANEWINVPVPSMPDVATDIFFGAYIMDDGVSSPVIDASISPPYHTIMQRTAGGGGPFGWYSSWHHVYIRALVRMYANPPPTIEAYDALPNSYVTTGREVTATLSDLGIPEDSTGVTDAWVHYRIDGGAWDSLSLTIISGDPSYGVWKAILPGINAGQTMGYYFHCYDMQGLISVAPSPGNPVSYTIREKTSDILFVNDDYIGSPYSYDVISDVIPHADMWDNLTDGAPDNSVINAGYNVIIWNSWERSGPSFADAQPLIEDYLDGGGNLLVSGMDIPAGEFGYPWTAYTTSPGDFLYDYFGIRGGFDDFATDTISVYFGRTYDEICGIFNEDWPITSYPYYFAGPAYNYNGRFDEDPDTTNWRGILYDEWGNCSAFRYELPGAYKVVWLYFPFAYIVDYLTGNPEIIQQRLLIERILDWFNPEPILRDLTQYSTTASPGPYPVDVTLINFDETEVSLINLIVSANGVMDTIPMSPTRVDTTVYAASIPAYSVQTDIIYYAEALELEIDTTVTPHDTTIINTWTSVTSGEFWFFVPTANVLYVNESYDPVLDYRDVLDSLAITGGYDVYEPAIYGIPDSTVLPSYSSVIWNGDWGYGTILTKESAGNVLYDYMVNGGNIFFNSDEILGNWDGWVNVDYVPGEFPYDVLGVTHIYNDICYDSVYGVTGDPISDGIIAEMTFPLTNWNDEVDIDTNVVSIFTDAAATTCRGLRWDDVDNKVVFLPFMYVSLPKSDQITVLGNVLSWFGTKVKFSSDDKEVTSMPKVFGLSQNRPNPFSRRTNILYSIPRKTHVSLRIYNTAGQLVRTLVNSNEEPGYKTVFWDGLDKNNKRVAQGVYFYRLTAGNYRATKKILIVR